MFIAIAVPNLHSWRTKFPHSNARSHSRSQLKSRVALSVQRLCGRHLHMILPGRRHPRHHRRTLLLVAQAVMLYMCTRAIWRNSEMPCGYREALPNLNKITRTLRSGLAALRLSESSRAFHVSQGWYAPSTRGPVVLNAVDMYVAGSSGSP